MNPAMTRERLGSRLTQVSNARIMAGEIPVLFGKEI